MTKQRRLPQVLGGLVGVLGLGFVARLMWTQRSELSQTLNQAEPAWLIVALPVGVAGMAVIGWSWQALVHRLGGQLAVGPALRAYFVGQLGKYVPGGVWAVVGRGEWARRDGVTGPIAYASTILSMVTAYVAASLVAGAALLATGGITTTPSGRWLVAGVVALGPAGAIGLHPRVLDTLAGWARRLSGRELSLRVPPWTQSLGVVARQFLAWCGISGATWLVAVALGADLHPLRVVLATCVAWTSGFLFLPVPGGIGVREAAFVAVLGQDPVVATVALAARLLFVLVDVTGAGLTSLVATRRPNAPMSTP